MQHLTYTLSDPRTSEVGYLGKTSRGDLKRRLREHLQPNSLHKKTHKNHWLKQILDAGVLPVIEEWERFDSVEALNEGEKFAIEYLRFVGCRLTNLTVGGEGIAKGSRMSEETCRKMSQAHMGKPCPKDAIWRARLADAQRGKKLSTETKQKMSISRKRYMKRSPIASRLVIDGIGNIYPSAKAASQATGVSLSNVYEVANGNYAQTKGYVFRWAQP